MKGEDFFWSVQWDALLSVLSQPAHHRLANQNRKWRQLSPSRGSASLSKVYYPIKWAPAAGT